jgi:hypothetical protein
MSRKRVFILGAGFSKQAGMPLSTDLITSILNSEELKEIDELQDWANDLNRRIAGVESEGNELFNVNIEQFFDFAQYDMELWRMKQQLCLVGRYYGETDWQKVENIEAWLSYIEEEVVHVVRDFQQKADLTPIQQFVSELQQEDIIITFNYDTLIETVLSNQKREWNHGFECESGKGLTVLKMHGSVDWILLERRPEKELEKFIKLFSKTDMNVSDHNDTPPKDEPEYNRELWRARDTKTCNAVLEMDKTGLNNFKYELGLAGLGSYKSLHPLPGSAKTWLNAFRALKEADEIYSIGFSMSPYDKMVRFHFASALNSRLNPVPKIVIIDPKAKKLLTSFKGVFGDSIQLINKKAENVDWAKEFA